MTDGPEKRGISSIKKLSLDNHISPYIGLVTYKDGSKVVVKEVRRDNMTETEILDRIGSHPNIVEKYGVFSLDEETELNEQLAGRFGNGAAKGIFFEYIDGGNLQDLSSREKIKYVLPIAYDVAAGLEHAHKKGVVHGDVKPLNIVITKNGHYKGAKVIDFDVSKHVNGNKRVKTERWTKGYVAPEVAYHNMMSLKTDVFCLGIVLYNMLDKYGLGNLPHLEAQSRTMAPLNDSRINDLVNSMLEIEERNRPTMAEVRKELEPHAKTYKQTLLRVKK